MTLVQQARDLRRRTISWMVSRTSREFDVTQLEALPEKVQLPLRRDGIDPVPQLAHKRRTEPVTLLDRKFGIGVWMVTGYAEAKAVLADSTTFSNDMRPLLGSRARDAAEQIGGLGMTDPPDHTRLRKLLTPEFTVRKLQRLEPLIDRWVAHSLGLLDRNGPATDLVEDFAFAIPFNVICELLGVSEANRAEFHDVGVARFDMSAGGVGAFGAAAHSREFLIDEVRRQRGNPGPGLIGSILRQHGDDLDDVELGGLADGVFLGGYETSASMLSMGTLLLLQNRETYAGLGDGSVEPGPVVEELLRLITPVQSAFARFPRHDIELFGHHIRKGDLVAVALPTANRDDFFGEDVEAFNPDRSERRHLTFGHGLHRCVGAELARMELRKSLVGLAQRFPDLRLAVDPSELCFRELSIVYGLDAMPVRTR